MKGNNIKIKCRHSINNICSRKVKTLCECCKEMPDSPYEPVKEIIADLTPYFTQGIKDNGNIIAAFVTVDTEKEIKAIEIVFSKELPQEHRNGLLHSIAQSLLNTCAEIESRNEQDSFLELMDGIQLKEWR